MNFSHSWYALCNVSGVEVRIVQVFSMSIFLRLASIVLLCPTLTCDATETAAGRWEGSIQIPGNEFLIVDLDQFTGKDWRADGIRPRCEGRAAHDLRLAIPDFVLDQSRAHQRANWTGKVYRT
jgi:hypothetical protein